MSVIMTLWIKGDPNALERFAAENPDKLAAIAAEAKKQGLIAHRFYGAEGQVLVVDEWPDAQSFQKFFAEQQPQIGPVMEAVGATIASEPTFWRELESHDKVGWEQR